MKLMVSVAVAVLAAVLLGTGASPVTATTTAATVTVTMSEWQLRAVPGKAAAGKVTFLVKNAGKLRHEFVVIKTDLAPNALPVKNGRASEKGGKGEIYLQPGAAKKLTLNLASGKYVLICNFKTHYSRGVAAGLAVKPAATTGAQTTDVNVSLFEMGFKLSKMTVPRGTVVFHLGNNGKLPHDFSFGSRGGGSPMIEPGQSATLSVKFATPGKYTFICTVEGHQEAGMIGVLTVT
jgi:uncharacterized cupredoxin-like copper-binding protein